MLKVLEERHVPVADLFLIASAKSRGTKLSFAGRDYEVSTLEDGLWRCANAALLSPGAKVSALWVPRLAEAGVVCIDNSSAFRQQPDVPLVVPEVNPDAIRKGDLIIANPNCSTIQLVIVLAPLHRAYGLEEVTVATYQSAAGAGQKGKSELWDEIAGKSNLTSPFPHPLFHNLIPAIGAFGDDGYCNEERKMILETRKILCLPDLRIFPTTVRVPIAQCHSEAVHLKFKRRISPALARKVLSAAPGVMIQDDPQKNVYPMPIMSADRDEVMVGRIRQVPGEDYTLDLWIVADNVRKGAATNGVEILELLMKRKMVKK